MSGITATCVPAKPPRSAPCLFKLPAGDEQATCVRDDTVRRQQPTRRWRFILHLHALLSNMPGALLTIIGRVDEWLNLDIGTRAHGAFSHVLEHPRPWTYAEPQVQVHSGCCVVVACAAALDVALRAVTRLPLCVNAE
jgi:hypothetical protein